ncbi:predicted protein, partial [Nematostella vectensis]
LAVVHFFAPWAPHCNQMNDVLEELAKENPHVNFIKVEAEKLPEVSYKNNINAVPTLLLFKNQKVVDRIDGANAPELTKKVEHHASIILPPEPCEQPETQDLTSRLKKLVNSSPCMLFMKGTPQEPKCGFSRQVVGILAGVGAQYSTFDILKDEEVRQGLKKYSDWPTYPQLYINGELVGGLDIIKELATSGELASMLPPKQDLKTRCVNLLKSVNVLLFMKGSPENPRCGFSRQICEILSHYSQSYKSFDILEDIEVREGLKKYSNWPTYPQLYVKGELIGGLDIVRELHGNGELEDALKSSQ